MSNPTNGHISLGGGIHLSGAKIRPDGSIHPRDEPGITIESTDALGDWIMDTRSAEWAAKEEYLSGELCEAALEERLEEIHEQDRSGGVSIPNVSPDEILENLSRGDDA